MADAETSFAERLDRLEQQVRRITEHLGLDADDGGGDEAGIPAEVVDLARAGRQMEAIRLYTKLTGADITTATSLVNAIV